MSKEPPRIVILSGPNGAGKSSAAARILRGPLEVTEFVNSDAIAQGLSAFNSAKVAFEAGGIMLTRLRALADANTNFAFETTLASRSFRPWISELRLRGYQFMLVFLWLPDASTAVARVANRVQMGGHYVQEETVRRRYERGLRNFFSVYRPLADRWWMYNNSVRKGPRLIAAGHENTTLRVASPTIWTALTQTCDHEEQR